MEAGLRVSEGLGPRARSSHSKSPEELDLLIEIREASLRLSTGNAEESHGDGMSALPLLPVGGCSVNVEA